jgi:2-polyprenyl-6-methoxyphenol hydroxylase-like FAD-dependent oxidoreductase
MGAGLSAFPFVLMLGQDDNERIMGARLAEFGITIEWSTALTALEQFADHARATLEHADGTQHIIRATYVAGCDGARSSVRDFSNIGFPGAPYEHVFFVADTAATGPMVPAELNVYLWKDGFHLFFPMCGKDRWRVIGILPHALRGNDALAFAALAPSIVREVGGDLEFKSCDWFSTYRIQHRCVERFRNGRAFLLGDAAHIHSPMGGQGMNTGLQDAYNLAWKLALVLRGQADDRLLDSYEAERMPVAQQLLHSTDRAFSFIVSTSPVAALLRTKVIARIASFAMKRAQVRTRAFRALSQIGISYPQSALSQNECESGPKAGSRFPWATFEFDDGVRQDLYQSLDDTQFTVLRIGKRDESEISDALVRTLVIPHNPHNDATLRRLGIAPAAFYVLRPDGHIGLASTGFCRRRVQSYLNQIGVRAASLAEIDRADTRNASIPT